MKEEITKTVETLLRDLASQLGTTTEYLWRVLVAQAPIDSIITLLQFSLVFPLAYLYYKWFKYAITNWNQINRDDLELFHGNGLIIAGIGLMILIIAFIVIIPATLTGFLNPEYWALDKLLDVLKRGK